MKNILSHRTPHSGKQDISNGNTLNCPGNNGHLFKVTAEKEVAWEYVIPITSTGSAGRCHCIDPLPVRHSVPFGKIGQDTLKMVA